MSAFCAGKSKPGLSGAENKQPELGAGAAIAALETVMCSSRFDFLVHGPSVGQLHDR